MNTPLWSADEPRQRQSHMFRFMKFCGDRYELDDASYSRFYQWSIDCPGEFWQAVADYCDIRWVQTPTETYKAPPPGRMLGAHWFSGGTLNFAQNLLPEPSDRVILTSFAEGRASTQLTAQELHALVGRCAAALAACGVGKGDRVAAVIGNVPEAIVAMLATTSLGAIWSSCSPDFGVSGVVDRFAQIDPKVVFFTSDYQYGGKVFTQRPYFEELRQKLPSVIQWVAIDHTQVGPEGLPGDVPFWEQFLKLDTEDPIPPLVFVETSFNHPVYILYSSGTTGVPKCIVHGAGGTLLQHKKELMLHTDLHANDKLLYFTTCGWMMWNWMVSALSCKAHVVLFDGSIAYPTADSLWRFAESEQVSVLGISPKYIQGCMNAHVTLPQLPNLKTILSTGSPLLTEHYQWVYDQLGQRIHLASISGGTDIISCFMLGNPLLPVYAGEIQGPGLGMKIEVWNEQGSAVDHGKGELICTQPFPSMPVEFWGDPDGQRYKNAYFTYYPNREVWRHGDYVEETEHGGLIVHGRSDATLNPGGVRIGSAEIYRRVDMLDGVSDSLVVGLPHAGDVVILLFVKLNPGSSWSQENEMEIKRHIRNTLTPRHVPRLVLPVDDIPYTRSGKKVEISVLRVLQGLEAGNKDALSNPQSLEAFANLRETIARILSSDP